MSSPAGWLVSTATPKVEGDLEPISEEEALGRLKQVGERKKADILAALDFVIETASAVLEDGKKSAADAYEDEYDFLFSYDAGGAADNGVAASQSPSVGKSSSTASVRNLSPGLLFTSSSSVCLSISVYYSECASFRA